jgi:translation initiation factor IF-2
MTTETKQNLKTRQPVIVVVGHVDHGKTTLLDFIRKAKVAEREAGGITQAVGAYEAEFQGKKLTFIDTPGHEAFSKMRARGAEAADVAILVVAADESVKPQTLEAIKTLNQTKTPYVVAINKIDKGGDIEKVKADLAAQGIHVDGYGGNIPFHGISAKTGEGVNELLELVVLTAELEHLSYDPDANPKGYVLEARMNRNRGIETTIILKDGVLRRGEEVGTPSVKGKARILENFLGKQVEVLTAGEPAVILGFENMPQAGEEFSAREIFAAPEAKKAGSNVKDVEKNSLRLILKSSDQGSLEALRDIITHLDQSKPLAIVSDGVGEVNDGDVKLAISTGSFIIGFKTKVDKAAIQLAEAHRVKIITSEIIYDLVKAVQDFFADLSKKTSLGELEVLAVFNKERLNKQVVGGRVTHGSFRNKAPFQVKRGEEMVGNGRVQSLQTGKKDAGSVGEGNEAGLIVNSQVEILVGDHLIINE